MQVDRHEYRWNSETSRLEIPEESHKMASAGSSNRSGSTVSSVGWNLSIHTQEAVTGNFIHSFWLCNFTIPNFDTERISFQFFQDIVKKVSDMISSALVVIEGETRSPDDLVEAIGKKPKNKKEKSREEEVEKILQVGVYLPCVRCISILFFFINSNILLHIDDNLKF